MTNSPINDTEELREQLAAIEHERWADWQKWMHKVIRENSPSPETLKVLERWDKQIATPYKDLSRKEQESDLEQVDRYWPLVEAYTDKRMREALEDLSQKVGHLPSSISDDKYSHIRVARETGKTAVYHGPIAQARIDGYKTGAIDALKLIAQLQSHQEEEAA
jgi:hypothetical protein